MDSDLLSVLYDKYRKELYLYIYSLCRNRDVSEDILQETFLKAMLSLSENHKNIRAWLYLVARNLYYNFAKKEQGKVSIEDAQEVFCEDSVIDKIIFADRTKALYQAISSLDRLKREVLVLQYFGALPQREIAAVLSLTPENVRVLSFRGKKEIKKYMEAKGYDI